MSVGTNLLAQGDCRGLGLKTSVTFEKYMEEPVVKKQLIQAIKKPRSGAFYAGQATAVPNWQALH